MESAEKVEQETEVKDKKKTEGEKKSIEALKIDTSKVPKTASSANTSPVKGNDDISK